METRQCDIFEKQMENAFNKAPVMQHRIDRDGRIRAVSDRWLHIFGYRREEVLGRPSTDFMTPASRALAVERMLPRFFKDGTVFDIPYRFEKKNGEVRDILLSAVAECDEQGEFKRSHSVLRDVTEEIRVQNALAESEMFHRATVESISDTVIITDDDGAFVYICPNVRIIFGMHPGEIAAMGDIATLFGRDIVDPGDVREQGIITNVEADISDVHGVTHHLIVNIKSVSIRGGTILYTCRDISDLKRSEEKLRALNQTLERRVAERTAELERRAAQLQHLAMELSDAEDRERRKIAAILHDDFQQQLAYIRMELVMLSKRNVDENIGKKLDFLEGLIGDCIERSRNLSYEINPPALNRNGLLKALGALVRDMESEYGLEVALSARPDAEPESLTLASILYRAVRELLSNVARHAGVDRAEMSIRRADGMIRIRIEDRGNGFDYPAVRTRQGRGAGFGLYSIEDRIAFLGGAMTVDTAPGVGCRIVLTAPMAAGRRAGRPLPADEETQRKMPAVEAGTAAADAGGSRPIRILLVDDHRLMREALANLLECADDLAVMGQAVNGLEAIQMAAEMKPDVILMDAVMPELNGFEAAGKIAVSHPDIRIIGLSMHNDANTRQKMLDAGADAYLTKTGSLQTLLETIRKVHRGDPFEGC